MLLRRTDWKPKLLISHRRDSRQESSTRKNQSNNSTAGRLLMHLRGPSWKSHTAPLSEVFKFRKISSDATRSSKNSQNQTNATARSSISSLCSCDCALQPPEIENSLFKIQTTSNSSEILYLSPLSPTQLSGNAQSWQLVFPENASQSPILWPPEHSTPRMLNREFIVDRRGALEFKSLDDEETQTGGLCGPEDLKSETLSESVERLIKESNKAFHAVGIALADARAVTRVLPKATTLDLHKQRDTLRNFETLPQSPIFKARVEKVRSKAKRKLKEPVTKAISFSRKLPIMPLSPAKASFRRTINEIFANKTPSYSIDNFQIEGYEDSTPGRRRSPEQNAHNSREGSVDSARSTEGGGYTPTDPFYLQCLSTRISRAQDSSTNLTNATSLQAMISQDDKQLQRQWTVAQKLKFGNDQAVRSTIPTDDKGKSSEKLKFQVPPRPLRSRSNSQGMPSLPTIPEISPFNCKPVELYDPPVKLPPFLKRSPEQYYTLNSTPFTMTAPLFCHGPIRIYRKTPEHAVISPLDEALDWTAFQMAILGTMDENGGDQRDDWEWAANETEIDNLISWFESFGFEGFGQMEGPPPKPALLQDEDKSVVSLTSILQLENFAEKDFGKKQKIVNTTLWESNSHDSRNRESTEEKSIISDMAEKRLSLANSLPDSPMLDLVVPSPDINREANIPMGYNLGYDLGDFLDWESKNVQILMKDD